MAVGSRKVRGSQLGILKVQLLSSWSSHQNPIQGGKFFKQWAGASTPWGIAGRRTRPPPRPKASVQSSRPCNRHNVCRRDNRSECPDQHAPEADIGIKRLPPSFDSEFCRLATDLTGQCVPRAVRSQGSANSNRKLFWREKLIIAEIRALQMAQICRSTACLPPTQSG